MPGACNVGDGIWGPAPGLGEPVEPQQCHAGASLCTPVTLSCLLFQESKPEQGLAGKSHSTGEQPSALSMATRYGARLRGPWQPLSASQGVARACQVLMGFTECTDRPGSVFSQRPGAIYLTWVPMIEWRQLPPEVSSWQSKPEASVRSHSLCASQGLGVGWPRTYRIQQQR